MLVRIVNIHFFFFFFFFFFLFIYFFLQAYLYPQEPFSKLIITFFFLFASISQAPSWTYILCAVGFFTYQSLDAVDGKQARRTNSSSQLGELFDHGCDAISMFLVLTVASSAVAFHDYPLAMLSFVVMLLVLTYFYHWQTYVSGTLYFKK